jgi:hydroxymethylbilane synthase
MPTERPIIIATRSSALALAQANLVASNGRFLFPKLRFELKILQTTGDKMQASMLAKKSGVSLPKGLFTKELEVALLKNQADLAVHSLKDLPTDLPAGLKLVATPKRADVRDVLIYRDASYLKKLKLQTQNLKPVEWSPGQSALRGLKAHMTLKDLPAKATVATNSTRRKAQLLLTRPDLNVVEIHGNLPTRLRKIAERGELDATVLALAGLTRLNFHITPEGKLEGDAVPDGLLATVLDLKVMLPCVGQGAIGIEIRADDGRVGAICERLNHFNTFQCVTAERAFLRTMGGGCQSPVAAYAEIIGDKIFMRAASFRNKTAQHGEGKRPIAEAAVLGEELATQLK